MIFLWPIFISFVTVFWSDDEPAKEAPAVATEDPARRELNRFIGKYDNLELPALYLQKVLLQERGMKSLTGITYAGSKYTDPTTGMKSDDRDNGRGIRLAF